MKSKKGVIDGLADLITALGTFAILIAVIFLIIGETKTQVISLNPCQNTSYFYNSTTSLCQFPGLAGTDAFSSAYNATNTTQSATGEIPGWLPIIVITIIGGLLLTLVRFFKQQ